MVKTWTTIGNLIAKNRYKRAKIPCARRTSRKFSIKLGKFSLSVSTDYNSTFRSRSALLMTETELKVMAALAKMGLRSKPMNG